MRDTNITYLINIYFAGDIVAAPVLRVSPSARRLLSLDGMIYTDALSILVSDSNRIGGGMRAFLTLGLLQGLQYIIGSQPV